MTKFERKAFLLGLSTFAVFLGIELWLVYPPAGRLPPLLIAVIVVFVLGHLFVEFFVVCLRDIYLNAGKDAGVARFPPWLTGLMERAIFFGIGCYFLATKSDVSTLFGLAGGWLGLKLALNWLPRLNAASQAHAAKLGDANSVAPSTNERSSNSVDKASARAQVAFWAGILSIALATTGALIATGYIAPITPSGTFPQGSSKSGG